MQVSRSLPSPLHPAMLGAVLCLLPTPAVAAPQDGQAPGSAPPNGDGNHAQGVAQDEGLSVHGSLRTWYRFRNSGGESDHDLYQNLYLDVGDEERHPVTFHVSGLLAFDLDDLGNQGDVFFDIKDTYDSAAYGRLYEAYVDVHASDALDELRLGRQMLYATPEFLWFDGLLVETEELTDDGLKLGAYGGLPVHVFESSAEGDGLFGAYATTRPWTRARLRLDYQRLSDETATRDVDNDLYSVELYQGVGEDLDLYGSYSRLDSDERDYRLRATYLDLEHDLTVQVAYYELLQTQADLALEINPFYSSLLEYFPYREGQLLVTKGLSEEVTLQGGASLRRLSDQDDEGEFNREFERYYLTVSMRELLAEDLDLDVTGEVWDDDQDSVTSWGASLTKAFDERWEASLGTYYSLYKFDLFDVRERNDVQTYALEVEYDHTKNLSFAARYEYEDDEIDDYHGLRLRASWRF